MNGVAERIKNAHDITITLPDVWNDRPCEFHAALNGGNIVSTCQDCGIKLRRHQRVGVSWLFAVQRGLLADPVGTGKTIHAAALMTLMQARGEINSRRRALVICRSTAIDQWQQALYRMNPTLNVITATGTPAIRRRAYAKQWDVLIIGPQMLLNERPILSSTFGFGLVISDDIDSLRNKENAQAVAVKKMMDLADRRVSMTGTPLQKQIRELWSVLEPMGSPEIFGSQPAYLRRYVNTRSVIEWERVATSNGGTRIRKKNVKRDVGLKNTEELKRLMGPLVLRRTVDDIDDVELPEAIPNLVHLELYPRQRTAYEELRQGVYTMRSGVVTRMAAMAKLHAGAKICGGMGSLEEGEDGLLASAKLDWTMEQLQGSMFEDKVVIFANYKSTIRVLQERLVTAGIGAVTIWGDEPKKEVRAQRVDQFWRDPDTQVLIGTTAIEQSLNLQCARHLIAIDTILNPARMEQLVGRIRRDGSEHKSVYAHWLRSTDTQEEKYEAQLSREQAVIDHIFDEESVLFEKLDGLALLDLIGVPQAMRGRT